MGRNVGRWGWRTAAIVLAVPSVVGCALDGTHRSSNGTTTADGGGGGGDDSTTGDDAGTSDAPPTVSAMAPLSGDYGTLITLDGDHFDNPNVRVELATPEGPITLKRGGVDAPVNGAILQKWDRRQIQFKYPFPAEGLVRVTDGDVQIDAGTFAPSWRPGSGVSGTFLKTDVLGVVAPAPGKLVTVLDGPSGPYFVVADGTSVTPVAYDRGTTALLRANVYATSNGDVEGFYATTDGQLWQMKLTGTNATTTATGVQLTADRPFFAGGSDGTGPYAWVRKTAGQIERVRPPTWTTDKGPIIEASGSTDAVAGGIGPDGSVVMAWEHDETSILGDDYVLPHAATLGPSAATFASSHVVGPQADDYTLWIRVRGVGPSGQLATFYCARDTDLLNNTTGTDCKEGYVGLLGTVEALPSTLSDRTVGWNDTKSVAMVCERSTNTLKVGPLDDASKQVTALVPCPPEVSIAADPSGDPVILVSTGNHLYSPRKL